MMSVEAKTRIEFETTRFGVIEVDQDQIIRFVDAIPGFPEAKRFVLVPHKEDSPFAWLQSVDIPELAFVVTDPWQFFADYSPVINDDDLEALQINRHSGTDLEALSVATILTIPSDAKEMTANLQAPVIINTCNNLARQLILSSDEYTTKHRLLPDS